MLESRVAAPPSSITAPRLKGHCLVHHTNNAEDHTPKMVRAHTADKRWLECPRARCISLEEARRTRDSGAVYELVSPSQCGELLLSSRSHHTIFLSGFDDSQDALLYGFISTSSSARTEPWSIGAVHSCASNCHAHACNTGGGMPTFTNTTVAGVVFLGARERTEERQF